MLRWALGARAAEKQGGGWGGYVRPASLAVGAAVAASANRARAAATCTVRASLGVDSAGVVWLSRLLPVAAPPPFAAMPS
eukprot:3511783-Prymnesium_polylepis.1